MIADTSTATVNRTRLPTSSDVADIARRRVWRQVQARVARATGHLPMPAAGTADPTQDASETQDSTISATIAAVSARHRILDSFLEDHGRPVAGFPRIAGMQKWEGRITSINDDSFEAELIPLDHEGPTVVADFETSLLAPEDDEQSSLRAGDMFYVTVRTVASAGGLKTRTSALRLRRVGRWTTDEVDLIKRNARSRLADIEKYAD